MQKTQAAIKLVEIWYYDTSKFELYGLHRMLAAIDQT